MVQFARAEGHLLRRACVGTALFFGIWHYFTPKYTRVGYMPTQPVAFQHSIHVQQLGMDCRYCHSYVEVSGHSNVPTTQTCMNCHTAIKANSPKLQPVRDSWAFRQIHRVGPHSPRAGLRVFQPLRARQPRGELRELPRPDQPDGSGLARPAAGHGVVPELPSQRRRTTCAPSPKSPIWIGSPRTWAKSRTALFYTQKEIGLELKDKVEGQTPRHLRRLPSLSPRLSRPRPPSRSFFSGSAFRLPISRLS